MTPQAPSQTVEDLGKLVKSKYPGTYDSLSDIDVGTKVKAKYPDAYGHFTDIQEKPKPPESTFSKLKGAIYDPTIGSIGQGARDLFTPGSRLKGAHEMITGAEKTAIPLGVAAAVANPEVTLPAMALGAAGEAAGKYIPKMFGASEDVSNLTGDIAGLAAGGVGAKFGPRISSAAKVAFPNVAAGAAKAGAGLATGAAMHGMGVPGSDFSTALLTRPGLRQAGKGLVEGAKELVNYGKTKPEAKELSLKSDRSLGPVESPKTLNIGQLERLVKIGRLQPEEFNNRLITELKYKPKDAEHLTELLKQSIEDEESDEGEGIKKTENPKPKKPSGGIGEVKSPKAIKIPATGTNIASTIEDKISEINTEKSPLEKQVIEPNLAAPKTPVVDFSKIDTTFRPDSLEAYDPQYFENKYNPIDKSKTIDNFQGETFDVQPQPDDFKESLVNELSGKVPERASITEQQIEESQSTARAAKETTLARHFADKTKFPELPKESEGTAEYLRAVGKDAGLKREPSRRTFENALKRARELRELKK